MNTNPPVLRVLTMIQKILSVPLLGWLGIFGFGVGLVPFDTQGHLAEDTLGLLKFIPLPLVFALFISWLVLTVVVLIWGRHIASQGIPVYGRRYALYTALAALALLLFGFGFFAFLFSRG